MPSVGWSELLWMFLSLYYHNYYNIALLAPVADRVTTEYPVHNEVLGVLEMLDGWINEWMNKWLLVPFESLCSTCIFSVKGQESDIWSSRPQSHSRFSVRLNMAVPWWKWYLKNYNFEITCDRGEKEKDVGQEQWEILAVAQDGYI